MSSLIGKYVTTYDGHFGIIIKNYKVTGRGMYIQIKQEDGRIWCCPETDILEEESNE